MKARVQKLLSMANVASRRAAEELIEQGRVRVNGEVVTLGAKADPDVDVIEVDGEKLRFDQLPKLYLAVYKPKNVLSTSEPHEGDERRTVLDLVPHAEHLFSIGRLDADSEGLMVLTNDGELANQLTHPRFRHTKTYLVTVEGAPSPGAIERWSRGLFIEGEQTAPCTVRVMDSERDQSILKVIMTEGKKRQIRRIAAALGHPVVRLIRTQIGELSIEGLKPGEYRELNAQELEQLSTPSHEFRLPPRGRPRRPERSGGRAGGADERPRRRESGEAGPEYRRRRLVTEEGGEARPRRPFGDRPPRREGSADDRPRRPFGDRPPRREGSSDDRPRRPYGDRPPRREGSSDDRPRRPRPEGSEDRPRRPYGDRPPRREGSADDRPRRPRPEGGEDRPRRPRPEGGGDRPSRPSGDRPPRREGSADDRPRRPRPEGGGDRPSRPSGGRPARPRTDRPVTGPRGRRNDDEE